MAKTIRRAKKKLARKHERYTRTARRKTSPAPVVPKAARICWDNLESSHRRPTPVAWAVCGKLPVPRPRTSAPVAWVRWAR